MDYFYKVDLTLPLLLFQFRLSAILFNFMQGSLPFLVYFRNLLQTKITAYAFFWDQNQVTLQLESEKIITWETHIIPWIWVSVNKFS